MRLGDWVIEEEIGRGAMGRVYRARAADRPNRRAAVKVLAEELAREPAFRERFAAEIDTLRKLQQPKPHPGIVGFIDSGVHEGTPYLVMEYVDGGNCESLLREHRRLPWADVLAVALQVAGALKHAHSRGVIHRDLKPANLLYAAGSGRWAVGGADPGGEPIPRVKLSDFGIAKLFPRPPEEPTATIVGTLAYLSPEQASGKPATKRSDLYALGGVLYTLVAGRPPFVGTGAVDLLHKHSFVQPERPARLVPDLPHELDHLIFQLLAKEPKQRPGDGGELLRELERIRGKLERKSLPLRAPPDLAHQETPVGLAPPGGGTVPIDPIRRPAYEPTELRPPAPSRRPWHNRVEFLLPAFLAVVGFLVWVFFFRRPGPEELYQMAVPLVESDDPADWDRAWHEYLAPLSRRYPDRHADVVESVREKVEDRAAQKRAVVQGRAARPYSEAERFYMLGLRHCQGGDWPAARRVWEDLVRAFGPVESERRWVQLARHGLATLSSPTHLVRDPPRHPETVREAAEKIRQLRAAGKTAEADAARRALLELYRDDASLDDVRRMVDQE